MPCCRRVFNPMFNINIHLFLLFVCWENVCICCRLLTSFKINFLQTKYFKNTIRVSNGLGPVQDRHSVGPDLGTNWLHRLLTDAKVAASEERIDRNPHSKCVASSILDFQSFYYIVVKSHFHCFITVF